MDKLNQLNTELGFAEYTSGKKSMLDVLCITGALMAGTAGLPHVIVRFYTVPKVRDARISAGWALFFIALLYTTAPAVAAFARTNLINTVSEASYTEVEGEKSIPQWFKTWEDTGLLAWVDKNGDGKVQYVAGAALAGKPSFAAADDGTPPEARAVNASSATPTRKPRTSSMSTAISSCLPTRRLRTFRPGSSRSSRPAASLQLYRRRLVCCSL